MKNQFNRGITGIAVLWILAALSAMALSVLSVARQSASRAHYRLDETRAISLAAAAAKLERAADFAAASNEHRFQTGRVTTERFYESGKQNVRLLCRVETGHLSKEFEIGWRREGGAWRSRYWSEFN
jgi:hypothetical protein